MDSNLDPTEHGARLMTDHETELQHRVRWELASEDRLHQTDIEVVASEGVVTLSGDVDGHERVQLALAAAARAEGVLVIADELNDMVINPHGQPDAKIAEDIARLLRISVQNGRCHVHARIHHGCVTLCGHVQLLYDKASMEHAIRQIPGISWVTNRIEVRPTRGPLFLKKKIEQMLSQMSGLDASRISVATLSGKVTLRGHVSSAARKEHVLGALQFASGVTEVVDEIEVTAPSRTERRQGDARSNRHATAGSGGLPRRRSGLSA